MKFRDQMRGRIFFFFASSIDEGHCRMTAAAGNALRVEKKSAKINLVDLFSQRRHKGSKRCQRVVHDEGRSGPTHLA